MNSKPFWQSKTLIGLLVAAFLPAIAKKTGAQFDDAATQAIADAVIEIIGYAVIIYGRCTAKHDLTVKSEKPPAP